jgi:hypothetical protein
MEIRLHLEIPESLILPDGARAPVRGVAAKIVDGKLEQVMYTVEKPSGAWVEVAGEAPLGSPRHGVSPSTMPDGPTLSRE